MAIGSIVYPWCQKVLPLTYDESLSYYEQICKLIIKVNEVIEQLKNYDDVIAELQEAIVDIDTMKSNISALQSDVADLRNVTDSINVYLAELNARMDNAEDGIANLTQMIANINTNFDKELEALERRLTALFNTFTADFTEELKLLQLKVNQIKANMQNQIDKLAKEVDEIDSKVVNPWRSALGKISIQKNVDLMYLDLADAVPLASEYASLGLTGEEYSKFGLSARDYVQRGREKLHMFWVYSPVFGWKQEISNVLTSIVDYLCDTVNASVYAELGLSADDYSAFNMTAEDYYKFNPEENGLYVRNGVLQSSQYIMSEHDGVLEFNNANASETDGVLTVD